MSEEIVRAPEAAQQSGSSLLELLSDQLGEGWKHRLIAAGVLLALAVASFFLLGGHFSSAETYSGIIASLDAKRTTVMELVGGSTAGSAAISALPGDVGTPIAEKLIDISADFAVVLAAIYLEKYLLTVLGAAAFRVLIPASLLMAAAVALLRKTGAIRHYLATLAPKFFVFGIAIFLVVPASVWVSDMIDATYQASIDQALQAADEGVAAEDELADGTADDQNFFQKFVGTVTDGASTLTQEAQDMLNNFIETLAVMVVTSCVIPILVLLFFLWLVKVILGVQVDIPAGMLRPRVLGRR